MIDRFGGGKTYATNFTRAIALHNGMDGFSVLKRDFHNFQVGTAYEIGSEQSS